MPSLRELLEKGSGTTLLREMIGLAAQVGISLNLIRVPKLLAARKSQARESDIRLLSLLAVAEY